MSTLVRLRDHQMAEEAMTVGIRYIHITEDLLIEILSRLPVKSLLRFRSVCKNWLSLFHNPRFVVRHHNHNRTKYNNTANKTNNQSLLVVRSIPSLDQQQIPQLKQIYDNVVIDTKIVMSFLRRELETLSLMEEDDIDFDIWLPTSSDIQYSSHNASLYVYGPFKGILCIAGAVDTVLCNPATREFKTLPTPSFSYPKDTYTRCTALGFGFDPSDNDYKVVRILDVMGDHPTMEDYYFAYPERVQVYNSSNDSWREIDNATVPFIPIPRPCFGLLFKGAFHWTGLIDDGRFQSIFAFDFKNEVFRHIQVPDCCLYPDGKDNNLSVLNDSLALMQHSPVQEEKCFEIWVMNEYGVKESWTKLFTVGPLLEIRHPLPFWNDTELVLVSCKGQLLSCDLHTQEIKEFPVYGYRSSLRALPYTESLVSFKYGGNYIGSWDDSLLGHC